MTKFARRSLVSLGALSLLVCAAYYAVNQGMDGYLDYLVWKTISIDSFYKQIPTMAKHYRVIAVDS